MDCAVASNPDCTLSFVGDAPVPDIVQAWYQIAANGSPAARRDATLTVFRNGAAAYQYVAVNALPTALFVQAGRYQLNLTADALIVP